MEEYSLFEEITISCLAIPARPRSRRDGRNSIATQPFDGKIHDTASGENYFSITQSPSPCRSSSLPRPVILFDAALCNDWKLRLCPDSL